MNPAEQRQTTPPHSPDAEHPGPLGGDPPGHGGLLVGLRAAAVGTALVALVLGLRASGILSGPVALAVGVVLVLAAPVAGTLARRALFGGSMALGWIVVTWWFPLPVGPFGRATWLIALLAGGLGAWVAAGAPSRRLRQLVPAVGVIDLVPLGVTAAAAHLLAPWLRVRDGAAALSMLIPGWDNSAHVDMVAMLLRHGTTSDALGAAPDGETWQFASYPQGFHAMVATVVELLGGVGPQDAAAELVAITNGIGWVAVLAVGTLVAGLCALPGLRRHPAAASLITAVVAAGFLLGPGAMTLPGGFANFFVACTLTACVPLVAVHVDRIGAPAPLLAIGGLLVGVAHTWVLMLSLALPAAAIVLLPVSRRRWPSTARGWTAVAAALLGTGLGGLQVVRILSGLSPGTVLTTQGGITTPELGTYVLILGACLGLTMLALARQVHLRRVPEDVTLGGTGAGTEGAQLRAASAGLAVAVGIVVAVAIAWVQMRAWSSVTYYFWKYAIGLELVALVLAAIVASVLLTDAKPPPSAGPARAIRGAAFALLTVSALQVFGYTGVPGGPAPITPTAAGAVQRDLLIARAAHPSDSSRGILRAAEVPVPAGFHAVYLPPREGSDVHPISGQQWYLALTGRWTNEANARAGVLMPPGIDGLLDPEATRAALVLGDDPRAVVIVAPEQSERVRAAVGPDSARVLSW